MRRTSASGGFLSKYRIFSQESFQWNTSNTYQTSVRTRSPFLEFTPAQVTNLCKCVTPIKTTTKHKRAEQTEQATLEHHLERRQTKASCRAEMSIQFTEPWHFCVFYNSYPRTSSPFAKYAAKDLVNLCNCIEGKIVSTSTKKTSTSIRKTSTQKISASTKKVSTSTKKTLTSKRPQALPRRLHRSRLRTSRGLPPRPHPSRSQHHLR